MALGVVPRVSGAYSIKPSLETLVTHDIQATILAATVEVTDSGVAEAIEAALGGRTRRRPVRAAGLAG